MNGCKNRQVLRNLVKHPIFTLKIRQYRFLRVIVHQPVCKNIKNLGKTHMPKTYQKDVHFIGSKICNLLGLALRGVPPPIWSILQDKAQGMGKFLHAAGDWSLDAIRSPKCGNSLHNFPAKINPRYEGQYLDDMQHGYGVAMYVTTLEAGSCHLVTTSNFLQ